MCETERAEFDSWITDVQSKLQEIRDKKAVRARRRKQIAKRRTAASQERMRIISHLARNNKVSAERNNSIVGYLLKKHGVHCLRCNCHG